MRWSGSFSFFCFTTFYYNFICFCRVARRGEHLGKGGIMGESSNRKGRRKKRVLQEHQLYLDRNLRSVGSVGLGHSESCHYPFYLLPLLLHFFHLLYISVSICLLSKKAFSSSSLGVLGLVRRSCLLFRHFSPTHPPTHLPT
ncbi:hypothetical protein HOY80DRAFT_44270 [Tuber brumale]|nr:hypothetical protein HOY80DRAFT_44270 [Tuber brumale]